MSNWTHIVSAIEVETGINNKSLKKVIDKMLANAPEITGSEGNADIFVNIPSGYNVSSFKDGKSAKHYQTRAVISIAGDLRDRREEQTSREYKEFIKFLKKECNFLIMNKSVKVFEG